MGIVKSKQTSQCLSEEEKNILCNLAIMNKCGNLKRAGFSEISCFCHINTDKDFSSFTALREKGLIYYKENVKSIKKVSITEQGWKILEAQEGIFG